MHDGEVVWRTETRAHRQHPALVRGANLVLVDAGAGMVEAFKDRYDLVPRGVPMTAQQGGVLAAAHVVLTSEAAQEDLYAYLCMRLTHANLHSDIATIQDQQLAPTFRFHIPQYLSRRADDWKAALRRRRIDHQYKTGGMDHG